MGVNLYPDRERVMFFSSTRLNVVYHLGSYMQA
jgi:hypothetical protein